MKAAPNTTPLYGHNGQLARMRRVRIIGLSNSKLNKIRTGSVVDGGEILR